MVKIMTACMAHWTAIKADLVCTPVPAVSQLQQPNASCQNVLIHAIYGGRGVARGGRGHGARASPFG